MITAWIAFLVLVFALLALDLGVFHRKAHAVGMREAVGWSVVWVSLGVAFGGVVFLAYDRGWWGLDAVVDPVDGMVNTGATAVEKYLTGYVVEKSLSIDNIFVIATIFGSLAVPQMHQHRVLFWGVLGALAMRGAMIVAGARLIHDFHWLLSVFAMLGLRSLYFALAGMVTKFRHLKTALALVLVVVGGKMLAAEWLKQALGSRFNLYPLGVILLIMVGGVVASLIGAPKPRLAEVRHRPAVLPG